MIKYVSNKSARSLRAEHEVTSLAYFSSAGNIHHDIVLDVIVLVAGVYRRNRAVVNDIFPYQRTPDITIHTNGGIGPHVGDIMDTISLDNVALLFGINYCKYVSVLLKQKIKFEEA